MGTTSTAIREREGVELGFVLAIEGYEYLLTDGHPSDAIAAWAGSSWTKARTGLQPQGGMRQQLTPWSNELPSSGMRFIVLGEEFAADMLRSKPEVRSELTLGFDTGTSLPGGFSIHVKDASLFQPDEPVFIGNETFEVSGSPSGTTIPVAPSGSGVYHPFAADGETNRFPGPHSVAPNVAVGNLGVNAPVYVASSPTTWKGKKVALYVHRISNGVWDSRAEASVWFAGAIDEVAADGALAIRIDCDGIQDQIANATLMHNQWSAKPKEGYAFKDGDYVKVKFRKMNSPTDGGTSAFLTAATPGTGTNEFPSGRYTAQEFAQLLSDFLDGDSAIGASGSSLTLRWSAFVQSTPAGQRFTIMATESASIRGEIELVASSEAILRFLGFDNIMAPDTAAGGSARVYSPTSDGSQRVRLISELAPFRYTTFALGGDSFTQGSVIDVEEADGEFVDHTSLLPPSAQEFVEAGETWSFYSIGDRQIFLGKRESATRISGVTIDTPISQMAHNKEAMNAALRLGDSTNLRVKQIFYACDSFSSLISKLLASTDGHGSNHSEHDIFPFGAGIPWSLLGVPFMQSLEALEQSGVADSMALIVERPIRLWDAVRSDFGLRMAGPVWKNGGLVIAQWKVPNASTAEHVLTEANKADTKDTATLLTRDYLVHTLKIEYNRNPLTNEYRDTIIVRNVAAYEAAGGAGGTRTIKARNSYSGVVASGESIEALADMLTARFMPILSKPLRKIRRSVSHNFFHAAPGDDATVSDDRVRDPATGRLGISNRPGFIIGSGFNLGISSGGQGGYYGEVDVLFTEEDRLFPLAPSCEHAPVTTTATGRSWTAGYDDEVGTAGVFSLLVQQNAFSETSEPDDATHFDAGDVITITELNPADPASADSFSDTIASITADVVAGYDEIVLSDGFGNGGRPAFDSSKVYLVNFAEYDQVQESQQLVAYQADEPSGQIQYLAEPNIVSDENKQGSDAANLELLPFRHASEQFGDGVPVSSSFMRGLVRMANNLTNYKTAPHAPYVTQTEAFQFTGGANTFFAIWVFPFFIGDEQWPAGRTRKLRVAPLFRSDGVVTSSVRVTSSQNPADGDTYVDTSWVGPKKQVTFTSASGTSGVAEMQELDIVRDRARPWLTWITVEGNDQCGFRGLAQLELGPLQ